MNGPTGLDGYQEWWEDNLKVIIFAHNSYKILNLNMLIHLNKNVIQFSFKPGNTRLIDELNDSICAIQMQKYYT